MSTTTESRSADDIPIVALSEIGEEINTVFRAFADGTRLRILHLLVEDEICVGNLVKILQLPQPTVSRHLAYLRKASLVDVRKVGQWSHYSLAPARSCFQQKLYGCLTDCFHDVPELQDDKRRARELKDNGGCCDS
ncbi:ArsR/SmtB family transcription factor [Crateriforma conspicua]|uniref:HTH-type transcriptional repressor AseR n=1 Tax=Crateriforma conspicua TaxID=2527996 RepID=A0A5C5Y1N0_9PLAN|nr:metalloregulator ArsR/SmtB family transcription factor [Crateriforma conspicua]QDV62677.1 HTH-type transcriptional repressor AseR [Crateriforma conspicua]TWT68553.1 HTH-type transcriptional repressor AseR [Crateriforma conspicua]